MRVFITGASGYIGAAVIQDLIQHGYKVVGLARSDKSAEVVKQLGAEVLRGDLEDLDVLRKGAAESDAVIHCGFNHDFSKFKENCEVDARAIQALGEALEGSGRALIVTSGLASFASDHPLLENERPPPVSPRVSEQTVDLFTKRGVKTIIVRLPVVHGDNDHGFLSYMVDVAKKTGVSAYVGEGKNPWSAVHRLDSASAYRLALEKGQAGGIYHAVAEGEIPIKDVAEAIGKGLGVPVKSISKEDAASHFGWFAPFSQITAWASNKQTIKELGWNPSGPGTVEDILNADYCKKS